MDDRYRSFTSSKALAHLVEECGEVLAAAGKTLRFGATSVNPDLPLLKQEKNIDWLLREMDDLERAMQTFKDMLEVELGSS